MEEVKYVIGKQFENKTIKEFLKECNIGRGKVEAIRVSKQSFINGEYKHLDTPLKENDVLSFNIEEEIDFEYETSVGVRKYTAPFEGVIPTLQRRYRDTKSQSQRDFYRMSDG